MSLRISKIICLFLAGIMIFSLMACRNGEAGTDVIVDEYVYVSEYISLPVSENSNYEIYQMVENNLYYQLNQWGGETGESSQKLYSLNIADKEAQPVELPLKLDGAGNIMRLVVDQESCIHMVSVEYPEIDEETGYTNYNVTNYFLKGYRADGTELYNADITSYISTTEYNYIQYMATDSQNNLYLSDGNSKIWIFDGNGNYLFDLVPTGNWISGLGAGKSGTVYMLQYGGTGMELQPIDIAARQFGPSLQGLPDNFNGNGIQPGVEKEFLLQGSNGLYEYDIETQTYEALLNFIDNDINGNNVSRVAVLEDGRIFVYYQDYTNNESEIMLLTKTEASTVVQKEIITYGVFGLDYNIREIIVKFNKSNEKYRISVRDYSENIDRNSETGYVDAITRMNNDILTGNTPDLISLSYGTLDMDQMAAKGVLEDLSPYLDNSTVLSRDDLMESVLEAYTTNGILCGIPSTFSIGTIIAKSSLVGDRMGWTLEELMSVMNNMPEGTQIMQYATKEGILNACMAFNISDYIDWNTGDCHFNSEEFINVLEFANSFPEDFENNEDDPSFVELIREDKLLLHSWSISGVDEYQVMRKAFGEPITCIGYPSSSGYGSAINGNTVIAISADSKHKETAWSFLETCIKEQATSERFSSWGFSVIRSALEKQMEESMVPEYMYDMNNEIMLDEEGNLMEISRVRYGFGNSNEMFDVYASTQEDVDAVWELINNTTTRVSYDSSPMEIISEEAQSYFKGQKSSKEVADIIQNRIQIYVKESL